MAHVLLGWEFGANRGHARRLLDLGAKLRAHGHRLSFAVQRIDSLTPDEAGDAPVWQAPVSPRLLLSGAPSRPGPMAGMADILCRLGMDDAALVAAMVRGWHRLFEAARPDLVIAEFAPFMLMAARGRIPAVAVGTGFNLPPAGMAAFPPLIEGVAPGDQAAVLARVNEGLAAVGGTSLGALPEAFAADRAIPATFAELDPYAGERAEMPALPVAADFTASAGGGEEVFVYAPERIPADSPLWRGLAAAGLPVRVHVPRASAELQGALAGLGLAVEPEPLPFAAIAGRSRLLVSHGGHGFVCSGLMAGLPHVVVHYDLEKLLCGLAVARHGLGGHVSLAAIKPDAFAASLAQIYRDDALRGRARAAAAALRGRGQIPLARAVTEAVSALA